MLAMLEAASDGDSEAFLALLRRRDPVSLQKMAAITAMCETSSTVAVPFDVEYVYNDLAVGLLASATGRYDFFMERVDGAWYISEIQGTASECPF
jgi:hypothetical protein